MCEAFKDRLYVPAIDSIAIGLNHRLSQGWFVSTTHRHSGEDWTMCPGDIYDGLVGLEAFDLVEAQLRSLLRL